uniref:Uncharacterized protein n=1 Tax=Ananas comosus var. bracteatus TaxID=296719 RepID=A0A6V7NF96_ANACO|nr:unnamed protein product [Ananas comosus var. bracteatus]
MVLVSHGEPAATDILFALQLQKGVKRREVTYLAAIYEVSGEDLENEGPPAKIDVVLGEFKDVMPQELLKKLSPRRKVDHAIKLELGAKPRATAPYRMAPPELKELQRSDTSWAQGLPRI